jgi:outer membrane protein TolC
MIFKSLMSRIAVTVSLCFLLCLGAAAQEPQDTTTLRLTLGDALRVALSENPTVKVAEQTVEKQQYVRRGTYASLFPDISGSASYQRTLKKQVMTMKFGDTPQSIAVGTYNNISVGISASMPVINAQLWESLKITGLQVEAAVEQARSSKLAMVEQVTKAFYAVLMAKDSYKVYMEAYRNAVDNYDNVNDSYKIGLTSLYDKMTAEVSVANAEPNVYSAENQLYMALWQLKALLALDLDRDVECIGRLDDYARQIDEAYPKDSTGNAIGGTDVSGSAMLAGNAGLKADLRNNSDLKLLELQRRTLEHTLVMQKRAYLPTLNMTFSYSYFTMDDSFQFETWNPYSVVGLQLSIPIFDGGKRRSDVKQAQIDLSNANLQMEDAERSLRLSLMQYLSTMQTSAKQYQASQSSIETAEKGYDIAVKRYQAGSGTQLEINNSQLALTKAELNRSTSIYNWLTARTSLEKVEGSYITAE